MKNSTIWTIVLTAVILFGVAGAAVKYSRVDIQEPQVVCTMDAKQCPDGSYVGRSGPKCEFATCPIAVPTSGAESLNGRVTVAIGKTATKGGVAITPVEMTSDSRCPKDVVCVWAGNVNAQVKIGKGGVVKSGVLSIGTSMIIDNKKVTLTAVAPSKISHQTIKPADYRFTFLVSDAK